MRPRNWIPQRRSQMVPYFQTRDEFLVQWWEWMGCKYRLKAVGIPASMARAAVRNMLPEAK